MKALRYVVFSVVTRHVKEDKLVNVLSSELLRGLSYSERAEAKKLIGTAMEKHPMTQYPFGVYLLMYVVWSRRKSGTTRALLEEHADEIINHFNKAAITHFDEILSSIFASDASKLTNENIQEILEEVSRIVARFA